MRYREVNKLRQLASEFHYLPKYSMTIKSWRTYVKDYLGLVSAPQIINVDLKTGISFLLRAGCSDRIPINNIFVRNCFMIEDEEITRARTIIDIGAHIGIFSLFAYQKAPNAQIFVYAPEPNSYDLLNRNINRNNAQSRIHPFNLAVGGSRDTFEMYKQDIPIGNTLLKSEASPHSEALKVRVITLADVLSQSGIDRCDLLKINAEGSEYDILTKSDRATLGRIRNVYLQCHFINQSLNIDTIQEFLSQAGFFLLRKQRDQLAMSQDL